MTGRLKHVGFRAAGAAALIPSFAREGSGSSGRSFKAIYKGHAARARADSLRREFARTIGLHLEGTPYLGDNNLVVSTFQQPIIAGQ